MGAQNAAISKDHSVIHTWSHYGGDRDALIDMHSVGLFHTSGSFTPTNGSDGTDEISFRVYDDLVLVVNYMTITAFTPRWS